MAPVEAGVGNFGRNGLPLPTRLEVAPVFRLSTSPIDPRLNWNFILSLSVPQGEEPQAHHYIVAFSPVIEILDDSPGGDSDSSSVMFLSERNAPSPQEL